MTAVTDCTMVRRWDVPSEEVAEALRQRLEESQKHVQASVEVRLSDLHVPLLCAAVPFPSSSWHPVVCSCRPQRRRLEREHERLKEQQANVEAENIKVFVTNTE